MTQEQKHLLETIEDTFRYKVCAQGPRQDDKNGNGGCGNPVAITLSEIYEVLDEIKSSL